MQDVPVYNETIKDVEIENNVFPILKPGSVIKMPDGLEYQVSESGRWIIKSVLPGYKFEEIKFGDL